MKTSKQIRDDFIQFFKKKEHTYIKSAAVVPIDDPTLLFINAGMNQFKNIFLGKEKPKTKRAVNSQKCIRAGGKHNDLEEVGKDGSHHTFFEMLGNWSFGDYYKKEAIIWAWELLTSVWQLDKSRLYATVHHSDKEAYSIWQNHTDISPEQIEYHGDKDNFWEMGETGPCGPCSEIHIDLGADFCDFQGTGEHRCRVNGDCSRYIELWNLVFIRYNRDEKGDLQELDNHYVDTGAGFERLCMVLQGKKSNYETDLFMPIIAEIKALVAANVPEEERNYDKTPYLVIADHIRTLCVALADGGYPANEGRGYVLRRILRRAARYGRLLGLNHPFLHQLVDTVAEILGDVFPEIKEKAGYLKIIIKAEEDRFNTTLDKGLLKFSEILKDTEDSQIDGEQVFLLYDTYGFPVDLTSLLAEEEGKTIDEPGFQREMQKQRELARKASNFKMNDDRQEEWVQLKNADETDFLGYLEYQTESTIASYAPIFKESDDKPKADLYKVILDKTPFYAESGGQIGDKGFLVNGKGKLSVYDVKKEHGSVVHYAELEEGVFDPSLSYTATIDKEYRLSVARNHTATHLLHTALKEVLGEHVQQKGSLVAAEYLRFDFSHFSAPGRRELRIVEDIVNRHIKEAVTIKTEITTYDKARQQGAVALFGEKYEDEVRTVAIGDCSLELCGGTHLNNTGRAGLFKIVSESAVAAGVRRIEAVTGIFAERYVRKMEETIADIAEILHVPVKQISRKVEKLVEENSSLNKELQTMKQKHAGSELDKLIADKSEVNGISVVKGVVSAADNNALRSLGDSLKQKLKGGVGVLAAILGSKVALLVIVSEDLQPRLKAGKLAGSIAALVDGKGGGRNDMAMAGGKSPDKLPQAMNQIEKIIADYNG